MRFNTLASLYDLIAQAKPTSDQVESGFIYVIAAFMAIWFMIAGYLFWLNRRQENLRREVEMLRQEEAERQGPGNLGRNLESQSNDESEGFGVYRAEGTAQESTAVKPDMRG